MEMTKRQLSVVRCPLSVEADQRAHGPRTTDYGQRKAFTLVELLVVITIIGILAALITVAAVGALKTAQRTRIKAEVNQISGGVDELKNKTSAYPPNCQTDGTGPLDEATVWNDLKRYAKMALGRSQEQDALIAALAGLKPDGTPLPAGKQLEGGLSAGEALVFWLGGFSADPKYPISGEGGPSYSLVGVAPADHAKADPIESRKWVYPFDVSRLGPRDSNGYFDETRGRFLEYTDPKGTPRRINFWQYTPAKSDQPYLYFDTSRHLPGIVSSGKLLGIYDPPAATASSIALGVYAFKKVNPSATATQPAIQFVNPDKYQVIHCGIDGTWDTDAFARMSPEAIPLDTHSNDPTKYLLFPNGPFVGDMAETIVNFMTETKVEDAPK